MTREQPRSIGLMYRIECLPFDAGGAPSSRQLLRDNPVAPEFIHFELDRCGGLRSFRVGGLDRTSPLARSWRGYPWHGSPA